MNAPSPHPPESNLRRNLRYARFGVGGIFITLSAVFLLKVVFGNQPTPEDRIESGALSLVFLALGGGILFGLPVLVNRGLTFVKLMQEHPEEPWKWRDDWVLGSIKSGGQFKLFIPWVLGFYTVVLTSEALLRKGFNLFQQDPVEVALAVAGPLLGVAFLLFGAYSLALWRKYGVSTLELVENPGVIGGWLRVKLHSKLQLGKSDLLLASLKCFYIAKSSGQNSSSSRHLVWRQDREIGTDGSTQVDKRRSVIPIEFYIPYDCQCGQSYSWELELRARVAGPNYREAYKVPVYKTTASLLAVPQEAIDLIGESVDTQKDYFEKSRARVDALPGGGMEVVTPPISILIMKLICTGFAAFFYWMVYTFLAEEHVSVVGTLIVFILGTIFAFLAAWQWVGRRQVTLEDGALHIRHKILLLRRDKTISADDVSGIGHAVGGTMNGKSLSNVYIETGTKKHNLATGLETAEARWLSRAIHSYLQETGAAHVAYLNADELPKN